jgi:hypothetical protein
LEEQEENSAIYDVRIFRQQAARTNLAGDITIKTPKLMTTQGDTVRLGVRQPDGREDWNELVTTATRTHVTRNFTTQPVAGTLAAPNAIGGKETRIRENTCGISHKPEFKVAGL